MKHFMVRYIVFSFENFENESLFRSDFENWDKLFI